MTRAILLGWFGLTAIGAAYVHAQSAPPPLPARAFLDQYCVTCHNQRLKTAGLLLDQMDGLILHHLAVNGRLLAEGDTRRVVQHLADLWGYDVVLQEVDAAEKVLKEHPASPRGLMLV